MALLARKLLLALPVLVQSKTHAIIGFMSALKDLSGVRFGKLTALRFVKSDRSGQSKWLCLCDCGTEREIYSSHLLSGASRSCGCNRPSGKNHYKWSGYGDITGNHWNQISRAASGKERRKLEFTITIQYAWELFVKQNGLCALSGLPIKFGGQNNRTASLDRIDSRFGYVPGNVQWVHKHINMMKNSLNQDVFIELCSAVAKNCVGDKCNV